MAITAGTYRARVSGECVLGTSKEKHTPFIEFYLRILTGENQGGTVKWTGYFTENTNERSIQSLQICGWQGEDVGEFSDGELHGLDANEVDIVVEIETYQNRETGEERSRPRVAWINRPGGFLNTDAAMNKAAAAAFGERMRGLVLKTREKMPMPAPKPGSGGGSKPSTATSNDVSDAVDDGIPF